MGSSGREHQVPQWVQIHGHRAAQVSQEKHHKQTALCLPILGLASSLRFFPRVWPCLTQGCCRLMVYLWAVTKGAFSGWLDSG